MKGFLKFASRISLTTQVLAGTALIFMMAVTLAEVIGRAFGKPILGAYELISFTGGIVIGFSIPYTSWMRGHVYVDAITGKFSQQRRGVVNVCTRCFGILLFLFAGYNFISMGYDLYATKEVSMTLKLPFYPIAWGIGLSCFIQSIILCADIVKILGGQYE
jgi:TRAP-type C4-dicarboxylate transport system permease small subunit